MNPQQTSKELSENHSPDSLKHLFALMQAGTNYRVSTVENFLLALRNSPEAFLYAYNMLPAEMKSEDFSDYSTNFMSEFLAVIKTQPEDIFNHHFFSGLHERISVEVLRSLQKQLSSNTVLEKFIEAKDKPTKTQDALLYLMAALDKSWEHFEEKSKEQFSHLKKVSKAASSQSRIASSFVMLGDKIIKKKGIEVFLDFCSEIGLDIYAFCLSNKKSFSIYPEKISLQELSLLTDYSKEVVNKFGPDSDIHVYNVLKKIWGYNTGSLFHILSIFSNPAKLNHDIDKFKLLWENNYDLAQKIIYFKTGCGRPQKVPSPGEAIALMEEVRESLFPPDANNYSAQLDMYIQDYQSILASARYLEIKRPLEPYTEQIDKGSTPATLKRFKL